MKVAVGWFSRAPSPSLLVLRPVINLHLAGGYRLPVGAHQHHDLGLKRINIDRRSTPVLYHVDQTQESLWTIAGSKSVVERHSLRRRLAVRLTPSPCAIGGDFWSGALG